MKNTKNDKNTNQPVRTRRDNGAGSITLRKDGRWMGSIQYGYKADGKPKRITVYGKTQQEAKKKLREKSEEFVKNDGNIILAKSIKDWFSEWLYKELKYTLKPKSFDAKERTINKFIIPNFGYIQINQLTSNEVTINPALNVKLPASLKAEVDTKQVSALSEEEVKKLTELAYKTHPNGTKIYSRGEFIVFLLNTGLRFGEATALTWDDVDFQNHTITVNKSYVTVLNRDKNNINPRTKKPYATTMVLQHSPKTTRSTRIIPLNKEAQRALKGLWDCNKKYELVCANENGNPNSSSNLNRSLKYMLKRAGISTSYSVHSLRHTFATQLFRNHVDIEIISQLLGHADTTITYNTYIHIIQAEKIEAVGSLDFVK